MDFAHVTDLQIPEGNVIKITRDTVVLWEKQLLPKEFMKVGWLEATGTQYIDTGVAPSNDTRLKAHFYAGNLGSDVIAVLGSRESGTWFNSYAVFYVGSNSVSSGRMRADFNRITASSNIHRFPNTSDNTEYELDYNQNIVTLNNDSHTFTNQTFTSTRNIYLFTVNSGDAPDPRMMLGKFYYCQIYNDGTLVADLIPVLRLTDGKPGMYDLKRKLFLVNQGTGEFNYGTDSVNLFNRYAITSGKAMAADGSIATNSNFGITEHIPVVEGSSYVVSGLSAATNTGWTIRVHGFDSNGTWVKQLAYKEIYKSNGDNQTLAFTVDDNSVMTVRMSIGIVQRADLDALKLTGTVRALGAAHENLLWLESSGTQWIDTGYKPNDTTKAEIVAMITDNPDANSGNLLGARHGYTDTQFQLMFWKTVDNKLEFRYGNGDYTWQATKALTIGTKYKIETSSKGLYVDDTLSHAVSAATFQCNYNLYLFAYNNAGTSSAATKMRLYSCMIYDDDIKVAHLLPALRTSDSEAGMYDILRGRFLTNQGTGSFSYMDWDNMVFRKATYTTKANTYIETNGVETAYSNWTSTLAIDLGSTGVFLTRGIPPARLVYCAVYDEDMTFKANLGSLNRNSIVIDGVTYTMFCISDAKYLRLSGQTSEISSYKAYVVDAGEFVVIE